MTKEQRITSLEAKRAEMFRKLQFAISWPLYTRYWSWVEKTYPAKIAEINDKLLKLKDPEAWMSERLQDPEYSPQSRTLNGNYILRWQ